jgi:sugar lactone lactonase YvrE
MTSKIEPLVDSRCELGESPVWSVRSRRLFWLDIGLPTRLFRWDADSGSVSVWTLPELATGLALSHQDELIVVSERGVSIFDASATELLRTLAAPPFSVEHIRFNDCGCDSSGRLWTGTMMNDFIPDKGQSASAAAGKLLCVDTDLSCHVTHAGFGCPNTFVWSPDSRTLYVADSAAGCLYTYAYDLPTGRIANPTVFDSSPGLGIPDGSAMDADGCLWNARWAAGCVARFTPAGRIAEMLRLPADLVTSCAFGGQGLRTLFVTSARIGLSSQELMRQPLAGAVFALTPGVPGLPVGTFRGAG